MDGSQGISCTKIQHICCISKLQQLCWNSMRSVKLAAVDPSEPAQRSPIVVATVPGFAPGLDGQPQTTAEPTPEPPPILTPEPTPELQPAYFLYTVQPGDTVSGIAAVFAISPAYILWNNPDVVYDPNLVLVGEQFLIPSVDGIIYHVKPGDTLPDIAALYQIDPDDGTPFKKFYDPRKWLREGERGMVDRLTETCADLGSVGRSIAG